MANSYSNYKIIEVTPTLSSNEYVSGDALFNKPEIANAVIGNGGCSELISLCVTSKKAAIIAQVVYFMQANQSVAAANDAMNVSASDGADAKFLGFNLCTADLWADLGNFVFYSHKIAENDSSLPIMLQAEPGSTSVYFFASILGTQTYAASDLTYRFGIRLK